MTPIQILNASSIEPEGYTDRPTVKAVVIDQDNRVLLFSGALLGGGVETGEDLPTALARECLEEAGIEIEVLDALGVVIQFRDAFKKRYVIHGFLARFIAQQGEPTTTQENEQKRTVTWYGVAEAEQLLVDEIIKIEEVGDTNAVEDKYQSELFNTKTALCFLQEARKKMK